MKLFFVFTLLFVSGLTAQTFDKAIADKDWEKAISFEKESKDMNVDQLFDLGFAFFQLDKLEKSELYMTKAIDNGGKNDYFHFYRGVVRTSLKKYPSALGDFKNAAALNPNSQANFAEIGRVFAIMEKTDSAIHYLNIARKLPFENQFAYLLPVYLYSDNKNYTTALSELETSFQILGDSDTDTYKELVKEKCFVLGKLNTPKEDILSYLQTERTKKPDFYAIYTYLIQYQNELKRYDESAALIEELRTHFTQNNLPQEMMDKKRVLIEVATVDGKEVYYYAMLKAATETLDLTYLAFVYKEDSEELYKRIMTEKTIQLSENSASHLLCARDPDGTHYTFLQGWKTDEIPFEEFKTLTEKVIRGEIQASASSSYGTVKAGSKKKKKKK